MKDRPVIAFNIKAGPGCKNIYLETAVSKTTSFSQKISCAMKTNRLTGRIMDSINKNNLITVDFILVICYKSSHVNDSNWRRYGTFSFGMSSTTWVIRQFTAAAMIVVGAISFYQEIVRILISERSREEPK